MSTPTPDEFPRELLAAYVDEELDDAMRARVERWIADHPDAQAELDAQQQLARGNAGFWERAEPVEPSETRWERTHRSVVSRLSAPNRPRRRQLWALTGVAAAGIAAAAISIWLIASADRARQDPAGPMQFAAARPVEPAIAPLPRESATEPDRSDDPLGQFAILPIATDGEVVLERVPEFPAGWLPVGLHPLPGVLALASEEDVLVSDVVPSPAYPSGGLRMTLAPGDAPMIYAAKLR